MSKGSPPPAPDYTATAQMEGEQAMELAQWQTLANRLNQASPFGNVTYDVPWLRDEEGELVLDDEGQRQIDPTGQWSQQVQLSPEQQRIYDEQVRGQLDISAGGRQTAREMYESATEPGMRNYLTQGAVDLLPLDWRGLTEARDLDTGQLGELSRLTTSGLPAQGTLTTAGLDPFQRVSTAGLPQLSGIQTADLPARMMDAGQTGQEAIMSRLRPEMDRKRAALETQLANQGITLGSEAWNNAMDALGRQESDLLSQAAVSGIGLGEQVRAGMFGEQKDIAAEESRRREQLFREKFGLAGLAGDIRGQQFSEQQAIARLTDAQRAQLFGERQAVSQEARAGRGQEWQEQLSSAQLYDQRRRDEMAAREAIAADRRSTRAQQVRENMAIGDAVWSQRERALNLGQATLPSVGLPQTPQAGMMQQVAPPNLTGAQQAQYQGDLARYNYEQQQQQQMMSTIANLGMFMLSDRRLKKNVKKIGTHKGLNVYDFDYIWGERSRGFMADEVEQLFPDMVATHPSGYKMVNYGGLV